MHIKYWYKSYYYLKTFWRSIVFIFLKKLNISETAIYHESEVNDILNDNKRNFLNISLLLEELVSD